MPYPNVVANRGDTLVVSVGYKNGTAAFNYTDYQAGTSQALQVTNASGSYDGKSAEFIAERLLVNGSFGDYRKHNDQVFWHDMHMNGQTLSHFSVDGDRMTKNGGSGDKVLGQWNSYSPANDTVFTEWDACE